MLKLPSIQHLNSLSRTLELANHVLKRMEDNDVKKGLCRDFTRSCELKTIVQELISQPRLELEIAFPDLKKQTQKPTL